MYSAARLCELAALGDVDGLRREIAAGADINSSDYDQRTPLHIAAANGKPKVVAFLLENGAESGYDRFGHLPIHEAKRGQQYQIEKMLSSSQPTSPGWLAQAAQDADVNADLHEQMHLVFQLILRDGTFSYSMIAAEVLKFYSKLGWDSHYFELFTPPQIAKHVQSLISSKHGELSSTSDALEADDIFINIHDHNSLYTCFTDVNRSRAEEIVERYAADSESGFHVTYFKSRHPTFEGGTEFLNVFYVERDDYENLEETDSSDVYSTSTPYFLRSKHSRTLHRYQSILEQTMDKPYPIVSTHVPTHTFKHDIKIGHRPGRSSKSIFLRQLSRTFDYLDIDFHKLHIDTFSNGVHVYSIFCDATDEDIKKN
jgi:glutamate dehydrogenase